MSLRIFGVRSALNSHAEASTVSGAVASRIQRLDAPAGPNLSVRTRSPRSLHRMKFYQAIRAKKWQVLLGSLRQSHEPSNADSCLGNYSLHFVCFSPKRGIKRGQSFRHGFLRRIKLHAYPLAIAVTRIVAYGGLAIKLLNK